MLAVLLLAIPEVPLDLALVSAAGLLVFTAAAEVVRSARSLIEGVQVGAPGPIIAMNASAD